MMSSARPTFAAVLLAAGSSVRMGGAKKEYLPLQGGTVLSQSARAFLDAAAAPLCPACLCTVLVMVRPGDAAAETARAQEAIRADGSLRARLDATDVRFAQGGASRQESVRRALEALSSVQPDAVLIHDAARPFVTAETVLRVLAGTLSHGAAIPGIPPVDTQKQVAADGTIACHLDRSTLAAVQTPQGFLYRPLLACHQKAAGADGTFTDDSAIWDAFPECTGNRRAHIVQGATENRKITFRQDIQQMEKTIRIGFGTDLHVLCAGRPFLLGGVEIPAEKGEDGHSDGDVLLHAITDAVLGASALGDIGSYFPPDDPQWRGAASSRLLQTAWHDVTGAGWRLVNLDCVVELERPKFLPWRQKVCESIAAILGVQAGQVFVKAKTNEKQDAVGNGTAVKAYCACLLERDAAL